MPTMPLTTLPMKLALALCLALSLAACDNSGKTEAKEIKEQVQRAYGSKDFAKVLGLAQKGLTFSREKLGDTAPDTLYFAQAISEAQFNLRNPRGAITAIKQELLMREAAGQAENKLQKRRTLLIQLAEENGDTLTAADQAVKVSRGINMGQGMDPQPVYQVQTNYPPEQYQRGVEGDVEIAYDLDATGAVASARVNKSTPPIVFDQAALESFRKWRFTPMLDKAGQPIQGRGFKFTLAFRLRK